MEEFITTAQAARLAGVGVSSIKRWADQELIRAKRTPGGHRRVLRADLMRFLGDESAAGTGPAGNGTAAASRDLEGHWAETVLGSDIHGLQGALLEARSRLGAWHKVCDEVSLGLREIGLRWASGYITALEEHVASERLTRALATLTQTLPSSSADPVCLLTCVEGDSHTLGLSLLQICLREAGWGTLWVGTATPVEELCAVAASGTIQMVALSASSASTDAGYLAQLCDAVGRACERAGTRMVTGGAGAWPENPPYGRRFRAFTPFAAYLAGLT